MTNEDYLRHSSLIHHPSFVICVAAQREEDKSESKESTK